MVAGQITQMLKLPLYLDSIGTFLVAILSGPFAGAVAGTLSNIIWGITFNPVSFAFAPVALVTGLLAGYLARIGMFRTWWLALISGMLISIPTTIVAVPITVFVFGGVTGGGPDFVSAYMVAVGTSLVKSVGLSNMLTNFPDKGLSALIAFIVASRLPLRLSTSFRFFVHSKVRLRHG